MIFSPLLSILDDSPYLMGLAHYGSQPSFNFTIFIYHTVIPYQTAQFISTNIFIMAIWPLGAQLPILIPANISC